MCQERPEPRRVCSRVSTDREVARLGPSCHPCVLGAVDAHIRGRPALPLFGILASSVGAEHSLRVSGLCWLA